MARLARGDESALATIVEREGPRLRALALRHTGREADADEIVNAVFLALWRSAQRWQAGRARTGTWLWRATVNKCIDLARRRRVIGPVSAPMPDGAADRWPDTQRGPELRLGARQELGLVRADIAALPARQRAAILLAADGERGVPEIAEIMGISSGAAEQLLVRARRTLRDRRRARDAAI